MEGYQKIVAETNEEKDYQVIQLNQQIHNTLLVVEVLVIIHLVKTIYINTNYMREGSVTIFTDNLKVKYTIEDGYYKAIQKL